MGEAPRLDCRGLVAGGFRLPPFVLRGGDAVCLHLPPSAVPWYEGLLPLLTGRAAHPGLRVNGSVAYPERPVPSRRWWGVLNDPHAGKWLTATRGISHSEAGAVLERLGIPAEIPVGRLGWNERTLLALEAILLHPPDLLVFDTAGNDPLGTERVFARLGGRSIGLALLYLKSHPEPGGPCPAGAECVFAESLSPEPAAAE